MAKKCKAAIGKLSHRIVIEKAELTSDGMGGQSETWSPFATLWAEIRPLKAWQQAHADTLEHRVTHQIRIRYRSGITSDMRVSFDSRIFQIKSIKDADDERKKFLLLMSEEGAAS